MRLALWFCFFLLLLSAVLGRADPLTHPIMTHNLQVAVWCEPTVSLAPLGRLAGLFQQTHKDVLVNFDRHDPASAYALLTGWAAIDPGDAPDLLIINGAWLAQFRDSLTPLDPLATTGAAQQMLRPALDLFTVDGHLLAVPWSLAARCLLVRSDLLAAKHLTAPQTWDQVEQVAAALHDPPHVYGLGLPAQAGAGGAALLQEMIWAEGEEAVSPTGALDLTGPGKVRALERYAALAQSAPPEALTWSQNDLERLFVAGRLGMVVTDTWAAQSWKKLPGMPAYEVLPLPAAQQAVGQLLGDGLAVFGQSKQRILAMQFAELVLEKRAQECLVEWGGLPVQRELLAAPPKSPLLAALWPGLAQSRIMSPLQTPLVTRLLDSALYLTLSGRMTPTEALAACRAALRAETGPGTPPGAPTGAVGN
jgi:ABC-type glycerol-3-phosphate transport system substrate-binding protein